MWLCVCWCRLRVSSFRPTPGWARPASFGQLWASLGQIRGSFRPADLGHYLACLRAVHRSGSEQAASGLLCLPCLFHRPDVGPTRAWLSMWRRGSTWPPIAAVGGCLSSELQGVTWAAVSFRGRTKVPGCALAPSRPGFSIQRAGVLVLRVLPLPRSLLAARSSRCLLPCPASNSSEPVGLRSASPQLASRSMRDALSRILASPRWPARQ